MKLDTIRAPPRPAGVEPRLFRTSCKRCGGRAVTSVRLQPTTCSGCIRRRNIQKNAERRARKWSR